MRIASRRGFTRLECVAAVGSTLVLTGAIVPSLGMVREDEMLQRSMQQLALLGQAHAAYAADWDGRQWTVTPDDLSDHLDGGGFPTTFPSRGPLGPKNVPSVPMGLDCDGEVIETRSSRFLVPFGYPSNCALGNFRGWNTLPFTQYVNGRVYDRLFWAPKDPIVKVQELDTYLDQPCGWPGDDTPYVAPTYCMATSAQFNPLVYGNEDLGPTHPSDLAFGYRAPNLSQALHPDQKTFMLEHYWLQNVPPGERFIPNTGGVPWFFNMSQRSVPATLFYDLHVRAMPHKEAILSDEIVQQQGEPSLIAPHDPLCLGLTGGYFESFAYEGEDVSSYHVFTADGILGRDTVIPE